MINTSKEKAGFFAENIRWIQPLIAAFILLAAPGIADQFGGFKIPVIVSGSFALLAIVYAGIMARLTDTLAAKIFIYVAIAAGAIALGAKLPQFI
ncbi:hypothetical protein [Pseudomonas sp. R5(2019)]|uniref:hypothetical protein n=1 Tax=Pseudomonas sp. R5(2019) TaxID=2697566 RepID=UPI0014125103|nr:hypothetical protein [Pseudomonas sp. R5(2019)]NBA95248.1 hypothetical protein [Pseudomonas sp. R5(2019)]